MPSLGSPTFSAPSSSVSILNIPMPAGAAPGEIIVFGYSFINSNPGTTTTNVGQEIVGAGGSDSFLAHQRLYWYEYPASNPPSNLVIDFTNTNRAAGFAQRFAPGTIGPGASQTSGGSNTHTAPSVSAIQDNITVVRVYSLSDFLDTEDVDQFNLPATQLGEIVTQVSNGAYLGISEQYQAFSGNSGDSIATTTNSERGVSSTFVIYNTDPVLAISQFNSGNEVTDGQQNVRALHNFTNPIASASLIATDGQSLNYSVSVPFTVVDSNNVDVNLPDTSSLTSVAQGVPFTSDVFTVSVQLSDGTDSASLPFSLVPKLGYEKVDVVFAVTDLGYFLNGFTGEVLDNDQILYDTSNQTFIFPNSLMQTNVDSGGLVSGQVFDQTQGEWKPHLVQIQALGDLLARVSTGHSLLSISQGALYIDGEYAGPRSFVSLKNGGLSSEINGRYVAELSVAADTLLVDGVAVGDRAVLYVSKLGKISVEPNGAPVARLK